MIHRCQILKADLKHYQPEFRSRHLSRTSYASVSSTNNEFATRTVPNKISGSSSAGFGLPAARPSHQPLLQAAPQPVTDFLRRAHSLDAEGLLGVEPGSAGGRHPHGEERDQA